MKRFKYHVYYLLDVEPTEVLQGLFDSKVVNIIKLFIREESKQFYLREIAKIAKVSPASTYRILNRLVGMGILKVTEIKTAKLYNLDSNKTVDFLKSVLEVDVVQYFVDRASQVSGVDEILLLSRDKAKANLIMLGSNVDLNETKKISGEIKERFGFTLNQMTLSREQYEQMSAMGLYPGSKKSMFRRG